MIIGSTREGRVGDRIARWFVSRAAAREEITTTLVDLADYDFPARYPGRPTSEMIEFAGRIGQADAFVVVTPEYNHSFPASLKQAIDFAYDEWQAKPVGFVSYGCRSVGMYAVEQLRTVFIALHAVTMRDSVSLDLLAGGEAGEDPIHAADVVLDQLTWWGVALRDARLATPYVS